MIQLKTWMLMLISAFKARLINTIGTWVLIKAQIIRFYELQELTGVIRLFPNLAPELRLIQSMPWKLRASMTQVMSIATR